MKRTITAASVFLGLLLACGMAWAQESSGAVDDIMNPKVANTDPAPYADCVPQTSNISAYFSEDMKASTINRANIKFLSEGPLTREAASVRYDAAQKRAIINPADPLEDGAAYRAVVTTEVKDRVGNRLDQDDTREGLQHRKWFFTVSSDPTACEQEVSSWEATVKIDLRNAATSATACNASDNGSYADCVTMAQLQAYGFEPTPGVLVNGIDGDASNWSASMQHEDGGNAFTYATFGPESGQQVEARRGTAAPTLP